jgi:16S rRNA U516 pseudouridylate synthase RsuA-like enzyme
MEMKRTATQQLRGLPPAHFVPMRLDKFLSQFTSMSRKDIENLHYGDRSRIQIRTHPATDPAVLLNASPSLHALVYLEEDHVLVDGQEIDWYVFFIYYLFNI